jgi:hypothetical protein
MSLGFRVLLPKLSAFWEESLTLPSKTDFPPTPYFSQKDNSTPHTDATKDKNNTIRDQKNETTPHRGIEPRALKEVNRGTVENTITYAGR